MATINTEQSTNVILTSRKSKKRSLGRIISEVIAIIVTLILFGIPFYFVIINAFKNTQDSAALNMSLPKTFDLFNNIKDVISTENYMMIRAFFNSITITVVSIIILILTAAMAGFVLQRKVNKATPVLNFLILSGLIIPPAVVPTIWVLQKIHLFKTMPGIILIEVALNLPFAILLYKGFMATIPKEIDEAALMDGCGRFRLFFSIIFPLLKPVTSTVIVLTAVGIYNDFVDPLYFFPGQQNATLQLTLYNFQSMFLTQWNLLFTDILLISLPPLIMFLFFNKRIVAGMTAGSIK